MDCKQCKQCTYTDNMVNLCLDKETRNLLLSLIKEAIGNEFNTYEFLYDVDLDDDMKRWMANSVKMHFDCLLPERKGN